MPRSVKALFILLLVATHSLSAFAEEKTAYKFEHMKGNVYRFTAGHYRSVFMVTKAGIFVTDPISNEAATYLRAQLAQRFDVPIRYIAYSHNHVDHTLGGQILAQDGADVLAHEYAAEDLKWARVPTAMPNITFRDKLDIALGDSRVELRYHGPNNGRGSVSMRFMPANVLYVVDWIVIGRMPYRDLPGYDIHGMIRSTREVLASEPFDLFIGGHAQAGTYKDVERYLAYLEALYAAVRDGMLAGKNLETLQSEIRLPEYKDLPMYAEWLPLNVAGVYKTLVEMSYFNLRPDIDAEL
ncbi:MBL fold metallo-hydrolase [Microbulbifer sp. SA54]|uniref:MBL fold metallo-hydrolase n=1 Tax=Microbulbifer sp. SA54 TaxID=3401577 RepID=UPI003AAA25C9